MNDLLCLHVEDSKKISWNKRRKMEKSGRREACVVRFLNIPTGITTSKILEIIFHILTDFTRRQRFTIVPYVNLKKAKKSEITRHFKGYHKNKEMGCITGKVVENNKYVNPGDFKKSRIHREEREMARLQRLNSAPRKPLIKLTENLTPVITDFHMVDKKFDACDLHYYVFGILVSL